MNKTIWAFETDMEGYLFFKEILIDLISYFPLTQSEAIDLINKQWQGYIFDGINIIYHDLPDVWAGHLYWGDTFWWIRGDERLKKNLPILKPLRSPKKTTYELWEFTIEEVRDHMFFDMAEKSELISRGLLTEDYNLTWSVRCDNYIEAKKEL
ncbi:MAG TPA: hypothetical protein VE710_15915 [Candidatus Bathyarchaeia archaeon]|nr:hypothetical protein [Candidatus Bathyarchaeia archaeon]